MSEPTQNLRNHARYYPMWHYFVFPVLAINVLVTLWQLVRMPSLFTLWAAVVSIAIMLAVFASRVMALTVQNRVIRLEERLRLARILPAELQPRIEDLTVGQLVALRFAADDEVAGLVKKVSDGVLKTNQEIKAAIGKWRADHIRA